jgi:MSHA biogenesis protein MshQ
MTYTKQCLLILLLFVVSSAQAELPPQLSPPPLDNLTIYSSAAITMGASSIVGGNIQVEAAVTLDATVTIGDFVEARDAGTIGADSTVGGHFTTGDAATLGATTIDGNIIVGGGLTAGAAILVGTKAVIGSNVRSGAATSTDFGADTIVNGNATAGTVLTLGADVVIDGKDIAKHPGVTLSELIFGTDSIATIPTPLYHDAGQIRLHAHYDLDDVTLFGSSNPFWVSPAKLVVSATLTASNLNSASATATPTHAAGENFTLTVSAFNSLGVITPNYSPRAMQLKLARTGPTLSDSVDGKLTYATAGSLATSLNPAFKSVTLNSFSSEQSVYTDAQYSEVGLLNLDLQDSNYGNTGIVIDATDINIGRFIPDHFTQTVTEHGAFMAVCDTATTFAYSGQKDAADDSMGTISYVINPVFSITARNKQGAITRNYYEDVQGSANDYMTAGILSQNDLTAQTTVALPKGVLHYQLSEGDNFFYNRSANTRVVPFSPEINVSPATIIDTDTVKATSTVDASPTTGVKIRFARLVLQNRFRPETSNLPQPMQIEHFTSNGFIVSSDNNCVSYDTENIELSTISLDHALTGALPDPDSPSAKGNFLSSKTRTIKLAAPGAPHQGQIGVTYEIYDWLKYDWNDDGAYDDNPSAVASFGQFRGNDRIISWKEVFNQ